MVEWSVLVVGTGTDRRLFPRLDPARGVGRHPRDDRGDPRRKLLWHLDDGAGLAAVPGRNRERRPDLPRGRRDRPGRDAQDLEGVHLHRGGLLPRPVPGRVGVYLPRPGLGVGRVPAGRGRALDDLGRHRVRRAGRNRHRPDPHGQAPPVGLLRHGPRHGARPESPVRPAQRVHLPPHRGDRCRDDLRPGALPPVVLLPPGPVGGDRGQSDLLPRGAARGGRPARPAPRRSSRRISLVSPWPPSSGRTRRSSESSGP